MARREEQRGVPWVSGCLQVSWAEFLVRSRWRMFQFCNVLDPLRHIAAILASPENCREQLRAQIDDMRRFIRRREVLQARLDNARAGLDRWLSEHPETTSMGDLALLQGLLTTRKTLFEELLKLDDDWLEAVLTFARVPVPDVDSD